MLVLQTVGGRLMMARKNKGWSQLDLLEHLRTKKGIKVSPEHWSRVESNQRRASLRLMIAASDLLEVSIDWLVGKNEVEYA